MTESATPAFEAIRVRVTRVLPAQIRAAVEKLDDAQIWWRPNETSNSVGNLVLHLSGSLNHYLNRNIGGFDYKRDRDAEFAARGPIPKQQLLRIFDDMVSKAEQSLAKVSDLTAPSSDPEHYQFLIEDLVGILTHISAHTGQILWITKMLNEGALDEIWMRTHKHDGAWRKK